jgi:uncharacterized membrane protein YhaH (DUF805 family)
MIRLCSECGAENQEHAQFCSSCGHLLKNEAVSSSDRVTENQTAPGDKHWSEQEANLIEFHFTSKGRIGQKEYFFRAFMPYLALIILLSIVSNFIEAAESSSSINIGVLFLFFLSIGVLLFAQINTGIKRLHDLNASGWWSLFWLVPLANLILLIILLSKGSVKNGVQRFDCDGKQYKQTTLRWVYFAIQLISILVLLPIMALTNTMLDRQYDNQHSLSGLPENVVSNVDNLNNTENSQLFPMATKTKDGARAGFIDINGIWVVQPIYDDAGEFSEGLAKVEIGGKAGFIDKKGNWVIQPIYDYALEFSDGLARVKTGGKYGFIDKKGNWVIQPIYDYASIFSEGLVIVEIGGKYGFIDKNGNLVIQPIYDLLSSGFSEGLARVIISRKYGFIDKKGNWVIQPIYTAAGDFSEGLAMVAISGKYGFIDKKGNWVIQPIYHYAGEFSEGLAKVEIGGKSGFIDKKGNWVIQPIYDYAGEFSEGLARAITGGKLGFIDKRGNWIIYPIYDSVTIFRQGWARVEIDGKSGIIDKKGNWVVQPLFDLVE